MRYTVLESENCEDGKQYPKGGCQERTRLLEAFVKPSGKSSRSTALNGEYAAAEVPPLSGTDVYASGKCALRREFRWYRGLFRPP